MWLGRTTQYHNNVGLLKAEKIQKIANTKVGDKVKQIINNVHKTISNEVVMQLPLCPNTITSISMDTGHTVIRQKAHCMEAQHSNHRHRPIERA